MRLLAGTVIGWRAGGAAGLESERVSGDNNNVLTIQTLGFMREARSVENIGWWDRTMQWGVEQGRRPN